jgi:hypothetical protein
MDVSFFRRELAKVPGRKIISGNRIFIPCPFHNETQPSGSIWIGVTKPGLQGKFKCWGCGKKADWNELAEKLHLTKMNGSRVLPDVVGNVDLKEVRDSILPKQMKDKRQAEDEKESLDMFPLQERWRGFTIDFLTDVIGAKLAYSDKTGYFYVWLPVMVRGKLVGYIKAQKTKDPNKKLPSYLNKPGDWVFKKGLFPFDPAVKLMRDKGLSTMVLVEGPRDAMRLVRAGIPAVAIMGTQNWTDQKRHLLESVGVQTFLLCMDGDRAGKMAAKKMLPMIKPYATTKVFRLWRVAEDLGLDKVDPCSAPVSVIRKLRSCLT